ncbi:MAG: flagellar assembly protein FliH [Spirochaetales bacterium]|nr:flagellar assembly protein FliH [Spirochaetales bacterium]
MAKHVFRPTEIVNLNKRIIIQPPAQKVVEVEEDLSIVDDTKDRLDELRREAEEFKANWESEKSRMIDEARAEAKRIIDDAENVAFDKIQEKTGEVQKIRQETEVESKRVLDDAKKQAEEIEKEINDKVAATEKEAYERGYKEGHEKGYTEGREEVERLIQRLHMIITKTIERRNQIIEESETQVINLVLLVAKKVIKVISENQKNVVINNVIQALRKMKGRGDVVIRVNLADLELTSSHIKEFQEMVENVKNITVLEDTSVDKGGCIIETDFGQIDARISSQLHEIEEKILEMMPIRARGEGK